MQPNNTDFKDAYQLGQAAEIKTLDVNGVQHVLVPPNCTLKSLEDFMPNPLRIRQHPKFGDITSFKQYIDEFKVGGSRIFVNEESLRFVTVFDFHTKDTPEWGDHSASMQLERAHEWERFKKYNERKLEPKEFAELLEDNVQYISTDESLTGSDLLTMAQNFKIALKGNIEVDDTLQSGLRTLIIQDDSTLRAQNSTGNEVSFPEKITFDLRIYKNQARYPITIWLRYRKTEKGLIFFIKIPDTDDIEEQAFSLVIDEVKKEIGLPTLKGAFAGPTHK